MKDETVVVVVVSRLTILRSVFFLFYLIYLFSVIYFLWHTPIIGSFPITFPTDSSSTLFVIFFAVLYDDYIIYIVYFIRDRQRHACGIIASKYVMIRKIGHDEKNRKERRREKEREEISMMRAKGYNII